MRGTPRSKMRTYRFWTSVLLAVLWTVWCADDAAAQQASIQGIVSDRSGGQILEAASVLVEAGGDIIRATLTDRNGFYQIGGLDPGAYTLRFRQLGYVAVVEPITLSAGQRLTLNLGLDVEPVAVQGVVVAPIGGAART